MTVLFCDVVGSTEMGERLDAEGVRELMFRYFHEMRGAIERHGGTVEKFVGDAVMAAFGVPVAHEDDAARAVRAALEMRDALDGLNPELERRFGSTLALRIGINTGEVVAGDPSERETFVTGDAVNVAARLEQHAEPGEILLGELTATLVGAGVEEVEPIAARGKAEPVRAFRVVGAPAPLAREERPLIGRGDELAQLLALFDERRSVVATVVGEPGVGKSRLVAELCARVSDRARIHIGRCLSYGEGITYWPLAEIVRDAASIHDDDSPEAAREKLARLWEADVWGVLAAVIGLGGDVAAEEVPWAFGRALATLARERPLLLVVEDIHWAEEALLELLDGLERVDAPMLTLCTARPEQTWREAVRLEPLAAEEIETLLATVPKEQRARIAGACGGNPLFAEELAAYLRERPDARETPPTLAALLTARLDLLAEAERGVAERGSVEGDLFHRGAVQALSDGGDVRPAIDGLNGRGLIHPAQATFVDDAAYRFRHALVRDAAYNGTAKRLRLELHEQFAAWLAPRAGDRVEEIEEILGYHLEQACRYREELGLADPVVSERAAAHLAAAGRRALWRGDMRTASPLLERALRLVRPMRLDVHLELDLATSIQDDRASEIARRAAERAATSGDGLAEALALVGAAYFGSFMGDPIEEVEERARVALPLLEAAADHAGLFHLWCALGWAADRRGRNEEEARAFEQALQHSRLAGERRIDTLLLTKALVLGPRPVQEALRTIDELPQATTQPRLMIARAVLTAMLGDEEALRLGFEANERLIEYGAGSHGPALAELATYLGQYDRAVFHLRRVVEQIEKEALPPAVLASWAPLLGHALCRVGRLDEAEQYGLIGHDHRPAEDTLAQAIYRQVLALVHSHRGEHAEAEALAREAVTVIEGSDLLNYHALAYWDLGEVLAAAGRVEAAAESYEEAIERFERKGTVAMVAQVRPRLAELQPA